MESSESRARVHKPQYVTGEAMGYGQEYGTLLEAIAEEADRIAMRYFRADELRVDRKADGSAGKRADPAVEEGARAKEGGKSLAAGAPGAEKGRRCLWEPHQTSGAR